MGVHEGFHNEISVKQSTKWCFNVSMIEVVFARIELHTFLILMLCCLPACLSQFTTGKDSADFYEQIPIILRDLLQRLNDSSSLVLKATNKALTALTKNVPAEELVNHIQFIRNLVASMVSEARYRKGGVGDGQFFLPGFNMPKGKNSKWTHPNTQFCENEYTIENSVLTH